MANSRNYIPTAFPTQNIYTLRIRPFSGFRLLVRVSQMLTTSGEKKKLGTQVLKFLVVNEKVRWSWGNMDSGRISIWPSNSTPRYLPRRKENMGLHEDLYANVHSSIMHNSQKVETTKISSTDEWIHKMWSIHVMECYSATQRNKVLIHATCMNLKNIMPSERSQSQKTTSVQVNLQKTEWWLPRVRDRNEKWLQIGMKFLSVVMEMF